jgi:hypothetical protein
MTHRACRASARKTRLQYAGRCLLLSMFTILFISGCRTFPSSDRPPEPMTDTEMIDAMSEPIPGSSFHRLSSQLFERHDHDLQEQIVALWGVHSPQFDSNFHNLIARNDWKDQHFASLAAERIEEDPSLLLQVNWFQNHTMDQYWYTDLGQKESAHVPQPRLITLDDLESPGMLEFAEAESRPTDWDSYLASLYRWSHSNPYFTLVMISAVFNEGNLLRGANDENVKERLRTAINKIETNTPYYRFDPTNYSFRFDEEAWARSEPVPPEEQACQYTRGVLPWREYPTPTTIASRH